MAPPRQAVAILILAASLTACGKSGSGPAHEQNDAGVEQAANNLAAPIATAPTTAPKGARGLPAGAAVAPKLGPIGGSMSSSAADAGATRSHHSATYTSPVTPGSTSLAPEE